MADYEKECFMVQGFSSSSAATPGSTHSEYVQEAQQGKILNHDYHRAVIQSSNESQRPKSFEIQLK